MAARAVVGRGLRETGAALKHASGIEVRMDCICVIFERSGVAYYGRRQSVPIYFLTSMKLFSLMPP